RIAERAVVPGKVVPGRHVGGQVDAVAARIQLDPRTPVVECNKAMPEASPPAEPRPEAATLAVKHDERAPRHLARTVVHGRSPSVAKMDGRRGVPEASPA